MVGDRFQAGALWALVYVIGIRTNFVGRLALRQRQASPLERDVTVRMLDQTPREVLGFIADL